MMGQEKNRTKNHGKEKHEVFDWSNFVSMSQSESFSFVQQISSYLPWNNRLFLGVFEQNKCLRHVREFFFFLLCHFFGRVNNSRGKIYTYRISILEAGRGQTGASATSSGPIHEQRRQIVESLGAEDPCSKSWTCRRWSIAGDKNNSPFSTCLQGAS